MKTEDKVIRVRFAPSPTGHLHIGSMRTALFNWLFARHHKGTFLVRIEDTDEQRSTKEFEQSILESLSWAGMQPDEPLIYQSQRQKLYQQMVQKLVDQGKAYKCYCPEDLLQQKKDKAISSQQTYQYDKSCRLLEPFDGDQPYVVRFKIDVSDDVIIFHDEIHGEVSIPTVQLDDFVIQRSDGTVTYNFAVVQDDHDMNISHVIRGEDHLFNTPKQMLLNQALGYYNPIFAHIPLILGSSGQKMSKRDAAVSVIDYKHEGYLVQALCNYLVRLGWAHGDQEIFTMQEMVDFFSLDDVSKSGAKFDLEKLKWVNSVYIKTATPQQLVDVMKQNMQCDLVAKTEKLTEQQRTAWIQLYQDRVHTLQELYEAVIGAYSLPASYDWDSLKKVVATDCINILQSLHQELAQLECRKEALLPVVKEFCKLGECKMSSIAQLLRFALLGTISGPGVFDIMELLGKQEVQRRISHLISLL